MDGSVSCLVGETLVVLVLFTRYPDEQIMHSSGVSGFTFENVRA